MRNGLKIYLNEVFKKYVIPFNRNAGKKAEKKSKRVSSNKEKMEILYEKVLDNLLVNYEKLTKTKRVKLFVTLSIIFFQNQKCLSYI